jgi:D-lactate dehydrogenase
MPWRCRTNAQVVELVRAAANSACRSSRGAGTGTCGGAVPDAGGIVVSFARMDRILALRPEDRCAVVEPGVLNGELQQALAPHGLFWPPDPSSAEHCSIGGNLATNAGGPRAVTAPPATTCSGWPPSPARAS